MTQEYSRTNPYRAAIKERYALTKEGSSKSTHHVVLGIDRETLSYNVGDSVAIFPEHDACLVEKTLAAQGFSGEETVTDGEGEPHSLRDFLTFRANITDIPLKLLKMVTERQPNEEKKRFLEELLNDRDRRKAFLEEREVWDFLTENREVALTAQELADFLQPLLPRFYSIASSQKHTPDEIHLTVSRIQYSALGEERRGVCSHYLCQMENPIEPHIRLYVQSPKSFALPDDPAADLIMIGPGTGVAPFRAFVQERKARGDIGRNWLFFGEQTRAHDFFYEEEWLSYKEAGFLQYETAFSRDQAEKVYVQHKMEERAVELFQWLENGAYVFVCGDAKRMARDVEATLLQIIATHGDRTPDEAKTYLKELRKASRYQRDVY